MKNETLQFVKELFGDKGEASVADLERNHPEVAEMVEEYALKVWQRPGLDLRDRTFITLASQITDQKWDQVENHMQGFLHRGGSVEELKELIVHLSVYCGFPTMITARRVLDKVIKAPQEN